MKLTKNNLSFISFQIRDKDNLLITLLCNCKYSITDYKTMKKIIKSTTIYVPNTYKSNKITKRTTILSINFKYFMRIS